MVDRAPLPVIVNRTGGAAATAGRSLEADVRSAFEAAGHTIELELVEGADIGRALERHASAHRIVVGGGDGSLSSAAGKLLDTGRELAILPLGTRNHFARQLGIPLDLEEAAALAAQGSARTVDCADAGGRTFINNASLGAYPALIRERQGSAFPKSFASLLAGWRVLRRLRPARFDLAVDGAARSVVTSLLFVGNNRYEIAEGKPGERAALDDGLLSIFAAAPLTRVGLVRAALRVALGRPDMRHDFALQADARALRIAGSGMIAVALDGERLDLPLPLDIAIRPGALQVVAPPD